MAAGETPPQAAYRLPAHLGEHRVMLIDYSAQGVLLEHYRLVPEGEEAILVLEWEGERVAVKCRVAHSEKFPVAWGSSLKVFRSRLVFLSVDPETVSRIDRIVRERHRISIALQMANASGRGDEQGEPVFRNGLVAGGAAPLDAAEFLRMCWNGCSWSTVCTGEASQPSDGFTVDAEEPSNQIHSLCQIYEQATLEGRELIRAQASLSLEGKSGPGRRSGQRGSREYNGRPPC